MEREGRRRERETSQSGSQFVTGRIYGLGGGKSLGLRGDEGGEIVLGANFSCPLCAKRTNEQKTLHVPFTWKGG